MSLSHCILGLIAHRPLSGYDLKATFDDSVAYIYNASGSQIYAALRQLERDGLVRADLIIQERRPNKKLYAVTDAGRAELEHWLAEPVPDKFSKDEFLVKIMFGNETDDAVISEHLQRQVENLSAQIAFMERERSRLVADGRSARKDPHPSTLPEGEGTKGLGEGTITTAKAHANANKPAGRARRYRILSLDLKIAGARAQLEECQKHV